MQVAIKNERNSQIWHYQHLMIWIMFEYDMDNVRICVLIQILQFSGLCMNLQAPVNVSIYSYHFIHLLTWEAGQGSPEETYFTVLVRSIKEKWKTVRSCALVHPPLQCNLTDVLSDPYETYYANVTAHLGNQTSAPTSCQQPFQPIQHTIPEPPLLKVLRCSQSLCVQLQSPSLRLLNAYSLPSSIFQYKLHVTVNGKLEFWRTVRGLDDVVLEHLPPGQEYCMSVSIVNRSAINRPAVCISTTVAVYNSGAIVTVALSLLVLLFGMCFVLLWVSGNFFLKASLPSVLGSLQRPYGMNLMSWSSDGFLTSISVEPRALEVTKDDEEVAEGVEGEEDTRVIYEGRQGQTLSGEEASEMVAFAPHASPLWNRSTGTNSGDHITETHTHPVHVGDVGEGSCSTAPTEDDLPSPCWTEHQRKPDVPLTTGLTLPESGMSELRQKHISPFRHAHGHEQGIGAESMVEGNIDLSSLTLGHRWGEKEKIPEEMTIGRTDNEVHVKPIMLTFLSRASDMGQNSQHTSFLNSNSNTSSTEEEEEVEEHHSGYLQRN